jgi:hypothetical protein
MAGSDTKANFNASITLALSDSFAVLTIDVVIINIPHFIRHQKDLSFYIMTSKVHGLLFDQVFE